jgi:Ca2+/H+ antiporter, TMEM165/GDT1 family
VVVVHWSGPEDIILEAFWVSTGLVALGEMGDKTQLLAVLLAARFKKPLPIIFGVLLATLANHALAGALGGWVAAVLGADVLRWVIGLSFIAMAAWMLVPDKIDETLAVREVAAWGVLGTTVVAFFLAEMGDKTQIATVALAARYSDLLWVVAGSTLGMMVANVPAVYMGDKVAEKIPMAWVHGISALIFVVLGVLTLLNPGQFL